VRSTLRAVPATVPDPFFESRLESVFDGELTMPDGFDPYHKWLGIAPEDQPPHHYRLLAINLFEPDPDVISHAADQRMAHVRNFQTGRHSSLSQKILNEITAAKLCLLKPDKREEYDRELRKKEVGPVPTPPPPPRSAEAAPPIQDSADRSPAAEPGPEAEAEPALAEKPFLRPATFLVMGVSAGLLTIVLGLLVSLLPSGPADDGSGETDDETVSTAEPGQPGQAKTIFDHRRDPVKKTLLSRYGANKSTEDAVIRGLYWLSRNQEKSGESAGSWSLTGPYKDGASKDSDDRPAATAMALLAMQGYGDTPRQGRFKKNVDAAWKWLLAQQSADGSFATSGASSGPFHAHGQCTIALCEIYGMTRAAQFKKPAAGAVDYCLKSQGKEGGWSCRAGVNGDVAATSWVVAALKTAEAAGLEVPNNCFERVDWFLDKLAVDDGRRYANRENGPANRSATAMALVGRQYLGRERYEQRMVDGIEWLLAPENQISFGAARDTSYWYFATQATYNVQGSYWRRWNQPMRRLLTQQQVKHGAESGSWDPRLPVQDQWASAGGRLYVTCLSICMLEVYYRHLPVYSDAASGR